VPSVATIKQTPHLRKYGVDDPDLEWGRYVFVRPWDESKFLASLKAAENTPLSELNPDGNRAVMYCTTTDPYQVIRHPDAKRQKELFELSRFVIRRSLELIRDHSTINVRILTRSPMAKLDFDLFQSFGKRLVFGMSLPTLRNEIAKIYEPHAPAPSQRLATLIAAKKAGIHVYVAMAPTYPECDEADLRRTLQAVAKLNPITIFHEPINIRAENVARIEAEAAANGLHLNTEVFATREAWRIYALSSLKSVWSIARDLGLRKRLHLWPDKALGSRDTIQSVKNPLAYENWLKARWTRISEWPK
jgi:DNA repair photolyase